MAERVNDYAVLVHVFTYAERLQGDVEVARDFEVRERADGEFLGEGWFVGFLACGRLENQGGGAEMGRFS